jgi:hypothetical protein
MIISRLAGIQYYGEAGITQECLDAVLRLIQYDDHILKVKILTSPNKHCLLITVKTHDLIAIKSGFSSGYVGEGPRKFSYLLQLLEAHNIDIDEYEVKEKLLNRLDNSGLTDADIKKINSIKPVRPVHFYDYIDHNHFVDMKEGVLWQSFRPVIPFAIIDKRIIDLAISFWKNPDGNLMDGYRRFEDRIRGRIEEKEHGVKLFQRAFLGSESILYWKDIENGEQVARANLIISAYSAYRNPRAHKEINNRSAEYLSEFLLLNHLFRLESEAIKNNRYER